MAGHGDEGVSVEFAWLVPEGVRVALVGGTELGEQVAGRCHAVLPFEQGVADTTRGLLGEAEGSQEAASRQFADAAARWHRFGVPYEEAQALLGQGRCLVALGQSSGGGSAARRGPRDLRSARRQARADGD